MESENLFLWESEYLGPGLGFEPQRAQRTSRVIQGEVNHKGRRELSLGFGRWACGVSFGMSLLVACRTAQVGLAGPAAAGLESGMRAAAAAMVREIPAGNRVVVANFTRAAGGSVSRLGVDVARQFSVALWQESRRSGDRIVVIDRGAGAQAVSEEMQFVVDRMNPSELLDRFRADYAVCGEYEMVRAGPIVRLDLRAVPTTGAELKFAECRDLVVSDGQFYQWEQQDKLPLSTASDSMTAFFFTDGGLDAVEVTGLRTKSGTTVPANGTVRANSEYRVMVRVKRECFLYVLGWDQTNGYLTVLFPGKNESALTGAGDLALPGTDWIRAIPPPGSNVVKVVVTESDIGLRSTGANLVEDAGAQNSLVARIRDLGPLHWGSATFWYYISE